MAAKVANTLFFVLLMFLYYAFVRYMMLKIKTEEYVDLAADEMAERHFSKGDMAFYQLVEMEANDQTRFPKNGWPTNKLTFSMRLFAADANEFDGEFVEKYNARMRELIKSGQIRRPLVVTGTN